MTLWAGQSSSFESPLALFCTKLLAEFYQQQAILLIASIKNQANSAVTYVMGYGPWCHSTGDSKVSCSRTQHNNPEQSSNLVSNSLTITLPGNHKHSKS